MKKIITMQRCIHLFALCFSLFLILWGVGCNGGGGGGGCPVPTLDIEVCDPETGGPFSLDINNPFFPVVPGSESVLEDGIRLVITVLEETEVVAGVETRILVESESEGDLLIEVSRNFFAQVPDGTVCYFGEDVDICPDGLEPDPDGDGFLCNGDEPDHSGQWRAGEGDNQPGIFMLADPQPGDVYNEEIAPGVAEDIAEVVALGETIVVPAGTFNDTLTIEDCNSLEGGVGDTKVYVGTPSIGIAIDADSELISF